MSLSWSLHRLWLKAAWLLKATCLTKAMQILLRSIRYFYPTSAKYGSPPKEQRLSKKIPYGSGNVYFCFFAVLLVAIVFPTLGKLCNIIWKKTNFIFRPVMHTMQPEWKTNTTSCRSWLKMEMLIVPIQYEKSLYLVKWSSFIFNQVFTETSK